MGDKDANETNIPNADLVHWHLRAAGIKAEEMQENLKGIIANIAHLESAKPWGHTKEYAGPFEAEYFAGRNKDGGGGGSQFVRDNAHLLGEETLHGLAMADWAVTQSIDLDTSSADLYTVDGTDNLGTGMVNTQNAIAENARKQNEEQERLK
jgi:hypothetical protein